MLDFDIQTVSILLASASVVAGVVYYAIQLRHETMIRQTDLIMRLQSDWRNREFRDSIVAVMNLKLKDYDKFAKKYPPWEGMDNPEARAVRDVGLFFDLIGVLLSRKLIDIEMVDDLFSFYIKTVWEKMQPIVEDRRKAIDPTYRKWFEYLYNEMKMREQRK
jgi:hypothetical protein